MEKIEVQKRVLGQKLILPKLLWTNASSKEATIFTVKRSHRDVFVKESSHLYPFPIRRYELPKLAKIVILASNSEIHRVPRSQSFELKIILCVELIDIWI